MENSFEELEVHMLICNKDVLLAVNNLNSLHVFKEFENVPIILHDDGSLNEEDVLILRKIKNVDIIFRKDADKKILEFISEHKHCLQYRLGSDSINLWHKIKLFDYFLFSNTKRILGIDSDLLFINKPEEIINNIKNNTPFYSPDIQNSYCFNKSGDKIPYLDKVNTGIIFIPSEEHYNINHIERALSNLVKDSINYFPSWIEQSAFAHMFFMCATYSRLDENKYRIPYFQTVDVKIVECLHFVSYPPVRETYSSFLSLLDAKANSVEVFNKDYLIKYSDKEIPLNVIINKTDKYLHFEYCWDLKSAEQFQLDHLFKIKIKNKELIFKFQSEKHNFFLIDNSNSTFELHHTYNWFGEENWEKLDSITI